MTGWRVGWLVVPPDLVRPIERLAQNFFISAPTLSQHAALAAFDCRDELDGHVGRYRANRDLLMAEPAGGGIRPAERRPRARSISMPTSSHLTNDSREFCRRMLREAGVATTPGVDFDRARGTGDVAHLLRRRDGRDGGGRAPAESMEAVMKFLQAAAAASVALAGLSLGAERSELRLRQGLDRDRACDLQEPELSKADRDMAAVYAALVGKLSGAAKDHLIKDQVRWIGNRGPACSDGPLETPQCLKTRYADRACLPARARRAGHLSVRQRARSRQERPRKDDTLPDRRQLPAVRRRHGGFHRRQPPVRRRRAEGQPGRRFPGRRHGRREPDLELWAGLRLYRPSADAVAVETRLYSYTGGAHGNGGTFASLVDLRSGRIVPPSAVFSRMATGCA